MVIALTLLAYFLAPGPLGLPRELWLLLGVAGLGLLVYSTLSDHRDQRPRDPGGLPGKVGPAQAPGQGAAPEEIEEALNISGASSRFATSRRLIHDRLNDAANQFSVWVSNISYRAGAAHDAYQADDLLAKDRNTLPQELEALRTRREREQNPGVQQQVDQVLESKAAEWKTLRELDARMRQAQLQMEQSLTASATVYGQVQLLNAESINSGHAERLRTDIQEQVKRLDDLVASLNEVYDYNT